MATLSLGLRRQDQKTMPAVRRTPGPNETQKYQTAHYNLAGDYLYGIQNAEKKLTLEEYASLVESFGKSAAVTFIRTPVLPTYEELAELTDQLGQPYAVVMVEEEGIE
jgi:hypothetical protein